MHVRCIYLINVSVVSDICKGNEYEIFDIEAQMDLFFEHIRL